MKRLDTMALPAVLLVVIGAATTARVVAQPAGFSRTVLQQVDLVTPGKEAVTARVEFSVPGSGPGRHTHFGEEIGYVVEGTVSVEIDGVTRTVKAGEAFAVPAGKPHNATSVGTGKATLLVTYIVDKGKPLATPVK